MTCVEREVVDAVEWARSSRVRREDTHSKSKVLGGTKAPRGSRRMEESNWGGQSLRCGLRDSSGYMYGNRFPDI